jgi:hypothetical protein
MNRLIGILILTSNRVGIFDEAFKSRIQLNLRYKNLDVSQRRQIWHNFIERLEMLDAQRKESQQEDSNELKYYGTDVAGIQDKIQELAQTELNGRQIRNTISTARQLAMYQEEPVGYKHLETVIAEASKFERYLLELNKNFSTDEIQRDKRER